MGIQFQIPRIEWDSDNHGELVKNDTQWEVHTTNYGVEQIIPLSAATGLVEHLEEMRDVCNHALSVLQCTPI